MTFKPMPFNPMLLKPMPFKLSLLSLMGISVLTLSACGSGTPTATETPAASPVAEAPAASPSPADAPAAAKQSGALNGGQVVEMGNYHMELLAGPESEGLHVDFWLQTSSDHAAIDDAKVTANIQFPNGTQKSVDLTYDEAGKHYKAFVPGFAPGEYRVVVQTEVNGEKMNGRFNFSL